MSTQPAFSVKVHVVQGGSSALRARADVVGQKMTFNGFTVLEGKSGLFVKPPSMKSGSGWVPVIEFSDKALEKQISEAVLKSYQEALADRRQPANEAFREQWNVKLL